MSIEGDGEDGAGATDRLGVNNPYVCTFTMGVTTPPDIPREAFNDEPLTIEFGAPIVWLAAIQGHPNAESVVKEWRSSSRTSARSTRLDLPPALIALGKVWIVTAILDGAPKVAPISDLTNATWVHAEPLTLRQRAGRWFRSDLPMYFVSFLILGLAFVGAGTILTGELRDQFRADDPELRISERTVAPGDFVHLTGKHFPKEEELTLRLKEGPVYLRIFDRGEELISFQTGGGSFLISFRVPPDLEEGDHWIEVRGSREAGTLYHARFTVEEAVE